MLIEKVVAYANQLGLPPTAATTAAALVALGQATGVLVLRLGWSTTFLVAAGLALGAGIAALWALRTR